MTHHEIFGVRIDDIDSGELLRLFSDWLSSDTTNTIVTPNPEFILQARRDPAFRDLLNRAELSLPDGVGLRFAVPALTEARLRHRHTGVDTLTLLAKMCAEQGKHLTLVGGDPGVANAASDRLRAAHPELQVDGVDPGIIDAECPDELLTKNPIWDKSSTVGWSVVAVGMGQGKQERITEWLRATWPQAQPAPRILIGVGGALDMLAGRRRRAPLLIRRTGLEWVWRLAIEPRRWRRIFNAAVVFPALVVWDTLKHRRFLKAVRATVPEIVRQLTGN
jgi:N-acetylglucosaminyldiphosphoundecaprenol N-acetyl-beta-D-mannosaminyltransferase